MIAEQVKTKIRLSFNRVEIKNIINYLKLSAGQNLVLSVLECALVVVKDNTVSFTTTNLEVYTNIVVPVESKEGEGSFCININYLKWFFNKAQDDVVRMEYSKDSCTLTSGRLSVKLLTEKAGGFPVAPQLEEVATYHSFLQRDFVDNLKRALPFCSIDELRPALTGVNVCKFDGALTVASTDAHRLFHKKMTAYDGNLNVVLCRQFVDMLCKAKIDDGFKLTTTEKYAEVKFGNTTIVSRLLDAKFPEWGLVLIPHNIEFKVNRRQMVAAIDLVSSFSNQSTMEIALAVSNKEVKVSGADYDFSMSGEGFVDVVEYNGSPQQPFCFAANARFLLQIFGQKPDENISIQHTGNPLKAFVVDDDYLMMPLMTNKA